MPLPDEYTFHAPWKLSRNLPTRKYLLPSANLARRVVRAEMARGWRAVGLEGERRMRVEKRRVRAGERKRRIWVRDWRRRKVRSRP